MRKSSFEVIECLKNGLLEEWKKEQQTDKCSQASVNFVTKNEVHSESVEKMVKCDQIVNRDRV